MVDVSRQAALIPIQAILFTHQVLFELEATHILMNAAVQLEVLSGTAIQIGQDPKASPVLQRTDVKAVVVLKDQPLLLSHAPKRVILAKMQVLEELFGV
jgi:hypothetical protein